ncbi:hypothetical protein ACMXYN_08400 [Neptuniibacter sp. PT8_73]|uniref:hypothetical protein n=1 Tax=Neptuniibacter sp. PT8_73 TaxID=3398206 RepID=UPI0039F56E87
MDRVTLSKIGIELSLELKEIAKNYNVRSDAYDILGYEAATIEEEALDLINETGVQEHIKNSTLLSAWGNTLASQIPEVASRVKEFHEQYHSAKNT